jgi:hypothetical protein
LQKKTRGEKSTKAITLNVKGEEKEQKKKRKIRGMKTREAHEDKDRLFKEGIFHGIHSLLLISKGKRKDQERKIISMKIGGAAPKRVTIFH